MGNASALDNVHAADRALCEVDAEIRAFQKKHITIQHGLAYFRVHDGHEASVIRAEWETLQRRRGQLTSRRSEALKNWAASGENKNELSA